MTFGHSMFTDAAAVLAAVLAIALITWTISVVIRNASIADIVWGPFFIVAVLVFCWLYPAPGPRSAWLPILVVLWALRLSGYIGWRNHGRPEDRRYRQIRERNQPHFAWKSLYLVFGLQGVLAWVIAFPLFAALVSQRPSGWLDVLGVGVWLTGWLCESVADFQLARFRMHQGGKHAQREVLDSGLWRYSRHPNYFGECCVWWGFYLIALSAGGYWTIFSPVLMTFLLLKVSGVALLENDITERRPAYRDYIARTNAFLPGPPHGKPSSLQDKH